MITVVFLLPYLIPAKQKINEISLKQLKLQLASLDSQNAGSPDYFKTGNEGGAVVPDVIDAEPDNPYHGELFLILIRFRLRDGKNLESGKEQ